MTTLHETLRSNGQKPALQNVESSLQLLPLIMNNIPQAVFWKDQDLVYLGCNQAFADDAGVSSPEEIIGKTDFDMPWKDQAELYRSDDRLVMQSGEPKLNYEEPQTTPNGSTIWLSTSKIPVLEKGQIVAVLGMYEDITERKKADETIKNERQRFQTILETIRVPTIISRLSDGQVLYANEALAQVSQVDLNKLIGYRTGNFYANPDDRKTVLGSLQQYGQINDFEVQFRRTDGSLYWALLSSRIVTYEGETCVLSTYIDITTRKQAEEALRESQQLLQTVMDNIPQSIFWKDGNLTYLGCNRAFAEDAGLASSNDVLGKTDWDMPWKEQAELYRADDSLVMKNGVPKLNYEEPQTTPDGSTIWLRTSKVPLHDSHGNVSAVLGMYEDISERKRLEQQVQTAFERRGLQVQLATQVSQSIAAASSLEELYERVVTQVKEQFGYYHTQILRYDAAQEAVGLVTGYGEVGARMLASGHRLPMGEGLIGTAAATGETVLRSTLENDPDWHPNPLLPETKGEIAVPIKLENSILGVLDIQSNVAGSLDADDQLLLEGLCGQIATAIESTRLRQEMAERLEEINRLYRAMSREGWQTYRETANMESSFMFDQGGLRPVEEVSLADELFASIPLTVPGGEVIGSLAIANDPQRPISPDDQAFLEQVSEQVALALEGARLFEQTQSALATTQESEERLSEALNIARLAHWEYDVEKDLFTFNDHFYSIFHTTAEQVGGYQISSARYAELFVHPEDTPVVGTEIGKALASTDRHYSTKLEHRILFGDGGVGYIAVDIHIERDETGKILRYYGANQDITERKQAEEIIAQRATQLAAVANVSTTASTLLNPDQLLQSVVDSTKERFGLYHAHVYLIDESWNTLLLAAGAGEVGRQMAVEGWNIPTDHEQSIVANAARSRQPVIANDIVRDATSTFLSNRLLPDTRSEMAVPMIVGEKVLGVFDVQSDTPNYFSAEDANIFITLASQVAIALQNARLYVEQAATLAQLRELDKLKSSFLANMSHELRTPLNSILGFTDVMLEGLDGSLTEFMDNDLRLIQKNGQHLLHLINDVLDMAKIEAGRMNLNPETFKVHEVFEEVTSITSTLAADKKLTLSTEADSNRDVEIYADRTRLRQVMINLVNNSIKFTEKGDVILKVSPMDGARVLIAVKDTGIGIPPEKLEAIFQEFTQVDSSTTRKTGGTGLGLPISRRLVEMHGGRLWAESSGVPGEGSVFYVELPVEARITDIIEKQAK